jgi:hypothetical protein
MPIISATQQAEAGGSEFKANLGKKKKLSRPYLKNKNKSQKERRKRRKGGRKKKRERKSGEVLHT